MLWDRALYRPLGVSEQKRQDGKEGSDMGPQLAFIELKNGEGAELTLKAL